MYFNIKVGISLDGPKEYHDKYRLYHSGHGSYSKTEKAINLLKQEKYDFGILSVIAPYNDPKIIYSHFVHTLGVNGIDFLWPDFTHNKLPLYPATKYGEFICGMLKEWTAHDDPKIRIRFINSYLNLLLGGEGLIYGAGADQGNGLHLITIRGDGELSTSDELMSTDPATVTLTNKKVDEISLKNFFKLPIFEELTKAFTNSPDGCKNCCWEKVCNGGSITHRFSSQTRFNNPSIYCESLKMFFSKIFQYLIESGIPFSNIKERLLYGETGKNI